MSNNKGRRWATKREAAEYARSSLRSVERWIDKGLVRLYGIDGKRLLDLDEVDNEIERSAK